MAHVNEQITAEEAHAIEQRHNVCVDIDTCQYNLDSHDAQYGWAPIPQSWIDEVRT